MVGDAARQIARQLVAQSPAMKSVSTAVADAIESQVPIVLEGEAGVGKEHVARVIHLASGRQNTPFHILIPPALPAALWAEEVIADQTRELQAADGGTLLIKDLWRFPAAVQKRVQRSLLGASEDHGKPKVWFMLSSRSGFDGAGGQAEKPTPLADLSQLRRIVLPPLRRRPADIPILAELFNREEAREMGREPLHFSARVLERFVNYAWPGNISELKLVIHRLLCTVPRATVEEAQLAGLVPHVDDEIKLRRFSLEELVRAKLQAFLDRVRGYHVDDLHAMVISQVERPLIELVLELTGGNQLQAAKMLGLNRNTLRKKIRALGIRLPDRRSGERRALKK